MKKTTSVGTTCPDRAPRSKGRDLVAELELKVLEQALDISNLQGSITLLLKQMSVLNAKVQTLEGMLLGDESSHLPPQAGRRR